MNIQLCESSAIILLERGDWVGLITYMENFINMKKTLIYTNRKKALHKKWRIETKSRLVYQKALE